MYLKAEKNCDVLVIGAGIAGSMAAIHAAKQGAKTIIVSSAKIFSGSSFYPGTWGLGLIGPENEQDEQDLCETIERVGLSMSIPSLVKTFVSNITPAIKELEAMGVNLCVPENPEDTTFIPCFDHKHRLWRGIEQASLRETLQRKFDEYSIHSLDHFEVMKIVQENEQVVGVIGLNKNHEFEMIGVKSIVIASGGIGGLFQNHLNSEDVSGMMQAIALKAGCICTNLEFMQIMPGFIRPAHKTIFNEKTFKYAHFHNEKGEDLLKSVTEEEFNERSTYGPFTSRLASSQIDYLLAKQQNKGKIICTYDSSLKTNQAEFIQVYFNWLKEKKKIDIGDAIEIGLFYHAANGGIKINERAETGVNGIYAAGEVCGGMHGADRIGGLSSANALVFGRIAGAEAANYAQKRPEQAVSEAEFYSDCYVHAQDLLSELQKIMNQVGMIDKNANGCLKAFDRIQDIEANLVIDSERKEPHMSIRLKESCFLAKALLEMIILRKESRGSFYRSDYPQLANQSQRIEISYHNKLKVEFVD